jgi:outer membrane protein insertion porin family
LIGLLFALARAAGPEEYAGRYVSQLSLVAASGQLPQERLEPLLRVQPDTLFDPYAARQDIALLYRVADVKQVEVDVQPGVAFDAAGQPIEAVIVEYRVYAPPRLSEVAFDGNRAFSDRELRGITGLARGDAWREDDPAPVARAVQEAYRAAGWVGATAEATVTPIPDGRFALHVTVVEGEPQRIMEVKSPTRQDVLTDRQVRRILARNGVREGRPFTDDALRAAQDALLAAVRARGYYEASIKLVTKPLEKPGDSRLLILLDPRRPWVVRVDRPHDSWLSDVFGERPRALPARREIVETLGLDEGVRVSRDWAAEAGRRLTEHERDEGWLEADIALAMDVREEGVELKVTGGRGRRFLLRKKDIAFTGQTELQTRVLRDAVVGGVAETLPRRWGLLGLGRHRVTPKAVDKAVDQLAEYYRGQGYLSAKLARTGFEVGPGRAIPVTLTIDVAPGPRAWLRGLSVEGASPGTEAAALFDPLVDRPYNPTELAARAGTLRSRHAELGQLAATVEPTATLSEDGTRVDVAVKVTPGPVVYARSVLVRGYRRTRRSTIEGEIDITAGQAISPSRLDAIRERLKDLGVFRRVEVKPVGDEDRVKDVVVTVDEKSNLYFEVGGGLATDEGVRAFSRAGHRNLFGLAHRLTLYGQAGLGWVGDGFSVDTVAPEWRVALRYEAPNLPTRGEKLAVDVLFNEQDQESTFRVERSGGAFNFLLNMGARGTASVGYGVQLRRLLDVDPGTLVLGEPWIDDLGDIDANNPIPQLPSDTRTQSGLGLAIAVDARNDRYNPTRGGLGTVNVDVTDQILSDVFFVRGEGSWTQLVPAGPLAFVLRGRGGLARAIDGASTLPLEERFRLGGGTSMRGFDVGAVGPANEVSPEYVAFPDAIEPIVAYAERSGPSRWVPTGGDAMALGTLELKFPFPVFGLTGWDSWALALFGDVGNVWFTQPGVSTDSMGRNTDPALRVAAGAGIRRSTPIGPVQVDLGFNLDPLPYRDEGVVRLHVSLGAL